jgi:hypothetical protein
MFTFRSEARMNELVAKANKPLAKLGLAPIKVVTVTPRKVKAFTETGREYTYVVYDVEMAIPEEIVKIEGTQVVARVENVEGLNMITRIGGYEGNLDAYRTTAIECQHCNFKRNRKGSWIVLNAQAQQVQVGDTCIDLYFGVDVARILRTSYQIHSILDSDDFGGGSKEYEAVERFVNLCAWTAATKGFVTKKQADEQGGNSTSSHAYYLSEPLSGFADAKERQEYNHENATATAWLAQTYPGLSVHQMVIDFWMEKEELTEFEHNCRVAILAQSLRYQGLVAYATKLWVDATKKAALRAQELLTPRPASQYQGKVSDKLSLTLTVKNIYSFATMYGTTTQIIFTDEKGNCFVWKASRDPQVTVGETYKVQGTVKEYKDYKGTQQTFLTRCTIN